MKKLLKALFRPNPKERNRVVNLRAVRTHQRLDTDYGDYEFNKRRAAALRKQAQERGDG